MGGGLLQLSIKGIEDNYLNNNPNINFFKKVYMRYTNFTMNSISVPCSNFSILNGNLQNKSKRLPYNESSHFRVKVPRNGDLIDHVLLNLTLPDISSDDIKGFQYVDNLGTSIIKSASLYIEDTLIETITGEFLYAYYKLHNLKGKSNIFDNMAGSIPKESYIHHNNQLSSSNTLNKYYNGPPSIQSEKLSIPLYFCFSKIRGLALPLIALKFHQVYIDIELRPFRELFTISETDSVSHTDSNNVVTSFNRKKIIKPPSDLDIESYYINQYWELNPQLEINYIFLDNKERNLIVKSSEKYLIEQVRQFNINNIDGLKNLEFEIYHPVKEMIIIPKRTDALLYNQRTNFTNLDYKNINDKDYQTFATDKIYTEPELKNLLDIWKFRNYSDIPSINNTNYQFYNKSIIESLDIYLDNMNRLEKKSSNYFTETQKLKHYEGTKTDGILTYSFSKYPGKFQPYGFCNMSELDNLVLNVNLKEPSVYNESYKYDLSVYFVNYNILDIRNGMGGLMYGNK